MEHKLIQGGEQWLPFARSRIKSLLAAGMTYAAQKFTMPDGVEVNVRITPGHEYVATRGRPGRIWVLIQYLKNKDTLGDEVTIPQRHATFKTKLFSVDGFLQGSEKQHYVNSGTTSKVGDNDTGTITNDLGSSVDVVAAKGKATVFANGSVYTASASGGSGYSQATIQIFPGEHVEKHYVDSSRAAMGLTRMLVPHKTDGEGKVVFDIYPGSWGTNPELRRAVDLSRELGPGTGGLPANPARFTFPSYVRAEFPLEPTAVPLSDVELLNLQINWDLPLVNWGREFLQVGEGPYGVTYFFDRRGLNEFFIGGHGPILCLTPDTFISVASLGIGMIWEMWRVKKLTGEHIKLGVLDLGKFAEVIDDPDLNDIAVRGGLDLVSPSWEDRYRTTVGRATSIGAIPGAFRVTFTVTIIPDETDLASRGITWHV